MADIREHVTEIIADRVYAVSNTGEIWVEGIEHAAAALLDEYDLTERDAP